MKQRREVWGELKKNVIQAPDSIRRAPGIIINGRRYKSFVFSTDIAVINNVVADAILAVYPFTPSPNIIAGIRTASQIPVAAGVGGITTSGRRSADMALFAESAGSFAVVVNAQVTAETISMINESVDIPIICTVIHEHTMIQDLLDAGADILNVSGGKNTVELVKVIREKYPTVPIIATSGSKDETILETIKAGADALSYTPTTSRDIFQGKMEQYRIDAEEKYKGTSLDGEK